MYVCMFVCMGKFITCHSYSLNTHECTKPKRCVFSLLQKSVNVSVGSQSDDGRLFQSFGAQAAKLCGLKLDVWQASTYVPTTSRAQVAATGTRCNWNTQLVEELWCSLMETLDRAELENYSLWDWQPVKIVSKCRCYALKLPFPLYELYSRVWNEGVVSHTTQLYHGNKAVGHQHRSAPRNHSVEL